ncbi:MAG TPA: ATP-binding cassette domain-containing protein [Bryobacteraceae bacterium]|nr:ATP-binding cassette domain-containing protein [Bryobacteraceae bacterium]
MIASNEDFIIWKNVTVFRDEVLALDDISLRIGLGENVAIVGPNGSGKSTLIKTVTRELYTRWPPPRCEMRILNQQIWNVWELRSWMGIVTNDLVQMCTQPYSVKETVLSGFHSSIGIWPYHPVTPEMETKAEELMEYLEITHLRDRLMTELSSGEARRAVIARALAHSPKALLLDEPSNSLDIRAMGELRDATRKLAQTGVAVILVTHHLPDIIPEIDRVICMKNGKLFRDGPKTEILTPGTLSELFGIPVGVEIRDGFYHMW